MSQHSDLVVQPDRVSQVVTAYYRDMMHFAVRTYLLHEAEAEGIVQQIFLELCSDLQQGIRKPDVPVRAWFFQRPRQRCLNYTQRERARYTDAEAAPTPQVTPFRALDEMIEHDLINCLREGVTEHLQGRTKDVMQLYLQGLAPKDIAAHRRAPASLYDRSDLPDGRAPGPADGAPTSPPDASTPLKFLHRPHGRVVAHRASMPRPWPGGGVAAAILLAKAERHALGQTRSLAV